MLVAQTSDLQMKADSSPSSAWGAAATKPDSSPSSALGAAATKPDSSPSYGGHTKQIRMPSPPEWLRAAVGDEADSLAFTARVRPASPAERPSTKPDSYHSWAEPRSKVVLLRLQQVTSGEAPSWSFGEASPNDKEGASVAFTTVAAENLCASDHESPSCAFAHSEVTIER